MSEAATIAPVEEVVKTIDADGFVVLGQADPDLTDRLEHALDVVADAARAKGEGPELHVLSCLHCHPGLLELVDWPPLLEVLVTLLSPNIYVHHSHLDVHPPHDPTSGRRWHRDGGVQGREMRLWPLDQPRLSIKAGIFFTDVHSPDDGAFELTPHSHLDTASRDPSTDPPEAQPMVVPRGSIVLFDARVWHRRRDNLGHGTRKAMFLAYTYRWITSRDLPFDPSWAELPPVLRQLLGEQTWEPFYPAPGELPVEQWMAARTG